MTLKEYRDAYYAFSSKASDVSRQLSFAGIALIWIFKYDKGGQLVVPPGLVLPALLFAAALAFDLLHSAFGALIWGSFASYHEQRGAKDNDEIDAPAYFNWPMLFCFWSKLILVVAAYIFVLQHVFALLKVP
jgi:hypothetical protein